MMKEYLDWKFLPDLILEQIFDYLSRRDRLSASCTCIPWNQTFYSPCLWKEFTYIPPSYLEQRSHRTYFDMATYNLSKCFKNIGHNFKSVIIPPISNFFILNRALNVMSDFYSKQHKRYDVLDEVNPLCDYRSKLETFSFEFDSQVVNGNTYGTGGTLLLSIKKLLDILSNVKCVRLKSLLLTMEDRVGLLEEFVLNNRESIVKLSLVDISKAPLPEFEIVNFTNLTELELSSFHMWPDFLVSLIQNTKIETLILTQTRFTLFSGSVRSISSHVWELVNELCPNLKVHQRYAFNNISEFIDLSTISIIYQPRPAPVTRFVFTSNNTSLLDLSLLNQYYDTLIEVIIIIDSATDSTIRSSIDEELLSIIISNPNITTLVLGGQRLSVLSSTILSILAEESQKIKHLCIEAKSVLFRTETITMSLHRSILSNDLISAAKNSDFFCSAVSAHLKISEWDFLSEKQFDQFVDKQHYVD